MEHMVYESRWDRANTYLLFSMPILILGVLFRIIPFTLIGVVIFFSWAVLCNNHEKGVVCALVFCKLLGHFGPMFGIHVPGTILALLLLIVFLNKDLFLVLHRFRSKPIFLISILFLFFLTSFLLTAETKNSGLKISNLTIDLIVDTFAFTILMTFDDIRMKRVTIPFLLFSVMQMGYVISVTGRGPTGLLDFTFFRTTCMELLRSGIPVLSYHNMGMASFVGTAFMISQRTKINTAFDYVFLFCSFWLILLSGARQTIFGFILLIFVWMVFRTGKIKLSTVFLSASVIVLIYLTLIILDVPIFQETHTRGEHFGSDLNRNYDYPLEVISSNFIGGIGFGNYYNPITQERYPHNIILEIMCEYGLIGMIFVLMVVMVFVRSHHFFLRNELPSGGICLMLWLPYLVRSMISSDISENICLFISMFILFYYRGYIINGKKLDDLVRIKKQQEMERRAQLALIEPIEKIGTTPTTTKL